MTNITDLDIYRHPHLGVNGPSVYPQNNATMQYNGNRFYVICNGNIFELFEGKTLEDATQLAEQRAHKEQAEAYILKPVRKVAPKRDVVTTEL